MHQEFPEQQPLQQQPVQFQPMPLQGQFNQMPPPIGQQSTQPPVQHQQQMPPQGQFGHPSHVQPHMQAQIPQENPGRALGIASLVLSILGILFIGASTFTFFTSLILGVPLVAAGFACGIAGRNKTPQGMPSGMAVAGIILGAIGIFLTLALLLLWMLFNLVDSGSAVAGSDLQYLIDALANY